MLVLKFLRRDVQRNKTPSLMVFLIDDIDKMLLSNCDKSYHSLQFASPALVEVMSIANK